MRVETALLPDERDSDDRVFTTDEAVIMLDGGSAFVSVPVPAATYAERLGRNLQQRLKQEPGGDLCGQLAAAIDDTARVLGLTPGQSPTSTVAVARRHGETIDLLVLGDTDIYTPAGTVRDDRMDQLDLEPRRAYRERLAQGTGYDTRHRELLRELQTQQATRRNRGGGYWIAEASPEAAYQAVTVRESVAAVPWVVLATDGAYEPMHHLGLDDWHKVAHSAEDELAAILRRCYDWEEHEDPEAAALPRSKRHDDKALATARLADAGSTT